ncbi:MAG: hypothetical protein WCF20_12275 [Methylovirgula sp.]
MAFKAGDFIGVSCEVEPGPFDDERLITVQTVEGPISGFVKVTELRETDSRWEVRGKIQEVNDATIKVRIYGSFFTTNGIASISRHLAMAA